MIDVIKKIADLQEGPKPNPEKGIGRECYAFSQTEDRAFELLKTEAENLFQTNGLDASAYEIQTDAIGNLFVTLHGKDREKTVMSGSHVDSVYKGGMYDGVAGVHSAFRFLETLIREGKTPDLNYTVAVFRAEEASPKTGNTCIGSRVATGTLKEADLLKINYLLDDGTHVPFSKYFQEKYGTERWQEVLEELKNPPIRRSKVVAYEELHIEQSAVCDLKNVDVGIVIDGIGGAIRQTVEIPFELKYLHEMEVLRKSHLQYTLKFEGEEAHTGGTPPNPTMLREDKNSTWYRRDALVAAALFANALIKSELGGHIKISTFTMPQKVGFTTVPKEQTLQFMIPANLWNVMEKYLGDIAIEVKNYLDVKLKYEHDMLPPGRVSYFDPKVFNALQIPIFVEQQVREKCQEQIRQSGSIVGRVRGTVTDFCISNPAAGSAEKPSVQCNLDFREVDPIEIEGIINAVHRRVLEIAAELTGPEELKDRRNTIVRTVSRKPHTPLDEEAIKEKTRIAEEKSFNVMKMPSLPGHDAASLGYIGIPISMTFVRHDGRSHTGFETMPAHHYLKAEQISHAFLAKKLGV